MLSSVANEGDAGAAGAEGAEGAEGAAGGLPLGCRTQPRIKLYLVGLFVFGSCVEW